MGRGLRCGYLLCHRRFLSHWFSNRLSPTRLDLDLGLSCIEADPNLFSPAGDFVRGISDQANLDLGSGLRLTSELYGSDGADDFVV